MTPQKSEFLSRLEFPAVSLFAHGRDTDTVTDSTSAALPDTSIAGMNFRRL